MLKYQVYTMLFLLAIKFYFLEYNWKGKQ